MNIEEEYNKLKGYYDKYLKKYGVKMPSLMFQGKYSKNALILIKLAENYPNTNIFTKAELTDYLETIYNEKINDMQQARHLGMQQGWYIIAGGRRDSNIDNGEYKLVSLEIPYPGYIPERRVGFSGDFEEIKKRYNYRCATCGSEENKHHLIRNNVITKLEKGHMNPLLPLEDGNIIPQCQICNKAYKSKWIFDATGRIIDIADTLDGKNIILNYIKKLSNDKKSDIIKLLNE